jgi:hypothetical protein
MLCAPFPVSLCVLYSLWRLDALCSLSCWPPCPLFLVEPGCSVLHFPLDSVIVLHFSLDSVIVLHFSLDSVIVLHFSLDSVSVLYFLLTSASSIPRGGWMLCAPFLTGLS